MEEGRAENTLETGTQTRYQSEKIPFGMSRKVGVGAMRGLDTLRSNIGFLSVDLQNRIANMFGYRPFTSSTSTGVEIAVRSRDAYGSELSGFKTRLEGVDGDLPKLYDQLHEEDDELSELFGKEKELLVRDIREEIAKKEGEARQEFEQKLIAHMGDLDKIREQAMKTEAGQQLMESAIAAMEKTVADMKEKVEQDVGKSTETLRNMLAEVERTPSY
jgi:hypothetical protein